MSVGNLVNYLKSKIKNKGEEMHFEHHCDGILWGSWTTVIWSPDCQETLQ